METLFKVNFHYDNPFMEYCTNLRGLIEPEYMRMRNIACDELNPHYDEWNAEFNALQRTVSEDDELADFGGTEYCNFINRKQQAILDEINRRENSVLRLYSTKECDIGGMLMKGEDVLTKLYITLKPVD